MKVKHIVCFLIVLVLTAFAGCGGGQEEAKTPGQGTSAPAFTMEPAASGKPMDNSLDPQRYGVEDGRREAVLSECRELAELCGGLMKSAEKERSAYFPYDTVMTREAVDAVESLLAEKGYPVLNTDAFYPEYLENSEGLELFAEASAGGEDARQAIISVSRYGSVSYSLFQYTGGAAEHICASVSWDGDGEYTISEPYTEPLRDWGMANGDFFYYRVYPFDAHWDACVPVRLHPADERFYELAEKYVKPLGYQCTNLLLVDWRSGDWGELSFNDAFEYLYLMSFGERVDAGSFEYSAELACCLVPEEIFERTLLPYFDISVQELRGEAMYIAGEDVYPWQPVISSNLEYFPTIIPEVSACRENGDGSVTLTVDALCFDEKCFPLYTHELTVMPAEDGSFRYLANELIYLSGHALPSAAARLDRRR